MAVTGFWNSGENSESDLKFSEGVFLKFVPGFLPWKGAKKK
jgi:hypothetical protein